MKIKNHLFMAALSLLALTACSSDDADRNAVAGEGRIPILLNSGVAETRAATNLQNNRLDQNAVIDVQIAPSDTKDKTKYDLLQYQVTDASGSLSPVKKVFPYYPVSGSKVNIFAVYPVGNLDVSSFSVQEEQLSKDQYKASDLMFAKVEEQSAQQAAVTLPFRHLLSKVIVNLTPDSDEDIDKSVVKLLNVATRINLTSRGVLGDADEASRTKVHMTNDGSMSSAAIIVPQDVPSGVLIEVLLKNNDVVNYETTQSTIFESGKKYTFNIKVVESELQVSSKVEPWIETEDLPQTIKL